MPKPISPLLFDAARLAVACGFAERESVALNRAVCAVHFAPCPEGGALAMGTDGHRMGVVYDPAGCAPQGGAWIFPRPFAQAMARRPLGCVQLIAVQGAPVARLLAARPDQAQLNHLAWQQKFGKAHPQKGTAATLLETLALAPIEESPAPINWRKTLAGLVPNPESNAPAGGFEAVVNPDLLAAFGFRFGRARDRVTPCLTIRHGKPGSGSVVVSRHDCPWFFGVLMTMRDTSPPPGLPDWLVAPAAEVSA